MIFTCLSHDIIAHEMTHALLDGLHPRFNEASNADVLAFHEAFADIVALFQHFTLSDVLRHQIARTRGDLAAQNLLGELAQQFGQAIGDRGALRSAIGRVNPDTGRWEPQAPDPGDYERYTEPHARGSILVAAVFEAFLAIYKRRVADLVRIASGGSGLLSPGELHPDLVNRLAHEAAKTAGHVLRICIRALDYCPPVDLTFGEYLRALITADFDLVPRDEWGYRIAFVDAFRRRGIYPRDVRSLSVDSLLWSVDPDHPCGAGAAKQIWSGWDLSGNREKIFLNMRNDCAKVHGWLQSFKNRGILGKATGLALAGKIPRSIFLDKTGVPVVEIHSIRPTRRVQADADQAVDLVIEITQRRLGFFKPDAQRRVDRAGGRKKGDFIFRGGCTMLMNSETGEVRYCIMKNILSEARLDRQRKFYTEAQEPSLRATYFGGNRAETTSEPFAMLHRGG